MSEMIALSEVRIIHMPTAKGELHLQTQSEEKEK